MDITPLQALARRITPITDVVYGPDHPSKAPKRAQPKAPAQGPKPHYSLVQDVIDPSTLHKLQALHGKLEAKERRSKKR